jgi:hypothetical protein
MSNSNDTHNNTSANDGSRVEYGYKPKNIESDSNTRTRGYSPGYSPESKSNPVPPPPPPTSGSNVSRPKK